MSKKILFLSGVLLLAGCASTPQVVDTSNSAKIRVFHGPSVYLHPGKTCYDSENKEQIDAAAGGFSMLVPNKKVGMPITDDTPWSYHEYVIPSGKPLTLKMYWETQGGGFKHSCGPVGATFTPETGKYYDTSILFERSSCSVLLRELIETSPGKASATIKKTTRAMKCY